MTVERAPRPSYVATRAWMLHAWRSVRWSPPLDPQDQHWKLWRHIGTVVLESTEGKLAHGESIWVLDTDEEPIGAAWEWLEWKPGVVILRDPMCIVSNVARDIDDTVDGAPEIVLPRDIVLNTIAHALPWQDEARRAIEACGRPLMAPQAAANQVRLAA